MLINRIDSIKEHFANLGRQEQLYIVPTLDGIKLLILNLILLIIGLVYANNYVLLFNFILFCLFIGSMYYTHFNLQGLKLASARFNPIHANEKGLISLSFKSSSSLGHHFLGIKINDQHFQLQDKNFTFSFESSQQNTFRVDVPILALKRGTGQLNRICIQTLFPFHLFRAFVYFRPSLYYVIYPQKKDLLLHVEKASLEEKNDDGDDFYLRDFIKGDQLKRVHWKKLAQSNRWYTKNLITPDAAPIIFSFLNDVKTSGRLEDELSSICFAIHKCHSQNVRYGLTLENIQIPPDHSFYHLNRCLKTLAEYEP